MWLIHTRTWWGPSRKALDENRHIEPTVQHVGFASRKTLGDALLEMKAYVDRHNNHYQQSAIEYEVVSAVEVPYLTDEQLEAGNIKLIDSWLEALDY